MKLSEIKQVLADRDIRLTKSLGQSFLHDQNQLERIAAAAELGAGDKVLEIGPGLGPLTEWLAARAGEVLAIEIDRRLFDFLKEKFNAAPNVKLIFGDALAYVKENRDWAEWKLVSNLPYSVASPILVELAQSPRPPKLMTTTLQWEVARRIEAGPGDKDYGVLTLLLGLRYQSRGSFRIPAACFFPSPEVDSACIVLERRAAPLLPEALHPAFTRIVKRGFSQRRKMMLKLLKQDWPPERLEAAFATLSLPPQIRAEKLSLEQFALLTEHLAE